MLKESKEGCKIEPSRDFFKLKQAAEIWGFKRRRLLNEVDAMENMQADRERRRRMSPNEREAEDRRNYNETMEELKRFMADIKQR